MLAEAEGQEFFDNAFDDNLTYIHKGLNLLNIVKKDNFEYYIDETVSILNYTGDSKIVEIPDIIDNKKVTVIENAAFFGNKTIEEIRDCLIKEIEWIILKLLEYIHL